MLVSTCQPFGWKKKVKASLLRVFIGVIVVALYFLFISDWVTIAVEETTKTLDAIIIAAAATIDVVVVVVVLSIS